ncbi:MAG TPA: tRNA (adenosine(37)-N6)-threonylcarbamoyltransferase complex dimerization subunit type 1 TsaB [Candidatus Saccharimonadales bacterium]|nr:tRNA (adenosine(37)-N6)-threonylcarbamoyltransferase complex dimerization subunit type 1 TsaB [Candidatus Saccharimonadales bacterium]
MKTVLFIDTSNNEVINVGLEIDGKMDLVKQKITKQKAQVVLPLIDKLLKKHGLEIREIGEIRVVEGPGSYTGLRVGISIANALSYALKIPVNGKKTHAAEPRYQ